MMTREKERREIRKAQGGDRRAQSRLYEAHKPWIHKLVGRFDVQEADQADLFQEATVAWLRALQDFDLGRGTRLITFTTPRMWSALIRAYDNLEYLPEDVEVVPLNAPLPGEAAGMTEEERTADSHQPPVDNGLIAEDRSAALDAALGTLPSREARVLRLRFGLNGRPDPMTQEEVGQEMGLTQSWISSLEERGLIMLRDRHPNLRELLEDVGR